MSVKIFDPKKVEVSNIGELFAPKMKNPKLKEFMLKKGKEDGNLSSIVVGDSERIGVGVGTWVPENKMEEAVPIVYEEVLFIVEGSLNLGIGEEKFHVKAGEFAYIPAGSKVFFGTDEPTRLVWVTSPPTWVALDKAFDEGLIKPGS